MPHYDRIVNTFDGAGVINGDGGAYRHPDPCWRRLWLYVEESRLLDVDPSRGANLLRQRWPHNSQCWRESGDRLHPTWLLHGTFRSRHSRDRAKAEFDS